jgi:hypothetical protein
MNRNITATVILLLIVAGKLLNPQPAQAIIFLPAIILIPIAQLVAFLLGGLTLPAILTGFIWSKLFKKSWKRGILYSLAFLLVLGLIAAIILKIITPERPLL